MPVIVLSQFLCTSVWFAGNAVIPDLVNSMATSSTFLAHITSAIQFGFITGTFVFALLSIADRYAPSILFMAGAFAASLCNLGISITGINEAEALFFRFMTGFFLAAIYPVGMKIASDYFKEGLGKSLGYLVGALVMGTALPYLFKSFSIHLPWQTVIYATSTLSVLGGTAMWLWVPNGPYRTKAASFDIKSLTRGFPNKDFRAAAFGYFGHMWELYTFWAFLPAILFTFQQIHPSVNLNIPLLSFCIIGSGGIACAISGTLSQKLGTKNTAAFALFSSGCCCLLSPLVIIYGSVFLLVPFLLFWGMTVVADSPLFSTLVAQSAPVTTRGTSLTIVNCIGFSITIVSIQLFGYIQSIYPTIFLYPLLALGPVLGLWALFTLTKPYPNKQPILGK